MTISEGFAAVLTLAMAIAAYWIPKDDSDYGRFADDTGSTFNTRNVVSNLGFLIIGAAGLCWTFGHRQMLGDDFAAAVTLFAGVIGTAFGSSYFHVTPLSGNTLNRFTLLWDRIPMTVAFAGLLALMLRDRVFHQPNALPLPLLVLFGIATTLYWYWARDLRPYAFFQLYAAAGTLLLIVTLRPSYTEAGYVTAAVFLFAIAKVLEDLDHEIHQRWRIGGHPLKHLAGAGAVLMILLWLMKRSALP